MNKVAGREAELGRLGVDRGLFRAEVDEALFGLDRQSVVLVRGFRGTGKTTVLRRVARRLLERGAVREELLFVDLEDPTWAPWAGLNQVRDLVDRSPKAKTLFLDGVERMPGWMDLARDLRASRRMAVLAASSGPADAPSPAGVHPLPLWPVPLATWIQEFTGQRPDHQQAERLWRDHLLSGGLPVARRAAERRAQLTDLLFSSLMRDVILMQPIRDTNALTAMAVHLLGNSGSPISASRLKGQVTRSVDQARMFLAHLEAAGLIHLVSRLEDAGRAAQQAARLVFAADTGLAWALRDSAQEGDGFVSGLALNAVFLQLKRMNKRVFSWKAGGRSGLAVGDPARPQVLLDVQVEDQAGAGLVALASAMERWNCESGLLLTTGQADLGTALAGPGSIETLPLWRWLLDPRLRESDESTAIQVEKKETSLPKHLL